MATKWKGYLLKNLSTNSTAISSYILQGSWDSTPNQREELEAYRDDNTRELHRVTADGMKSTFKFSTIPVDLDGKIAIQSFFTKNMINVKQRKVWLEYWNDDINDYKQGYFYLPNIHFPIDNYDNNTIYYNSIDIELSEY